MKKRQIKIHFDYRYKAIIEKILADEIEFVESDNPDYAFFEAATRDNCFGYDCVRILFSGENIRPDFNVFDYAIGFDDISFGDRYLRCPLFLWGYDSYFQKALEKHLHQDIYAKKSKFCNFVVSNGNYAHPFREEMFYRLSEYKRIDSAGGFLNNMDGWRVPNGEIDSFREDYKFTLCFENSEYLGYVTEKIIMAWSGYTVPIYFGAPDVGKYFNKKAFIDVNDFDSIDEAIEYIKKVDEDEELYMSIAKEPILAENSELLPMMRDDYIKNFLLNIFQDDSEKALRRINKDYGWGMAYEAYRKQEIELRNDKLARLVHRVRRGVVKRVR